MNGRFVGALVATLFVLVIPLRAIAQQAGGYSAGPGNAAPRHDDVGAPNEDDGDDVTYARSPGFTQDRDFTATRFWRLDPGRFTVEQWWTGQLGGGPTTADHLFQTELEVGLVPHVQLDVYLNAELAETSTGGFKPVDRTGVAAEVRYALPSAYGEIWGNPTLYLEVLSQYYNAPRVEGRLLLGGEIFVPRLLGALNLFYERNLWKDATSGIDQEIGASVGMSYAIVKNVLRLGVETKVGWDNHGTATLDPVLLVGPSVLLTDPKKRVKLLATVFHGLQADDAPVEPVVIVGTSF